MVAPAGEYVPAAQGVFRPPAQEYPAGHILLPDPEPLVEVLPYRSMDPAGQSYPASQGEHVVASAGEYVPAAHFVIRPFTQEYPAGQGLL